MKTNQNGFISGIIIGLVIWGLVAFFIIKAIPQPKQPTYTTTDSISKDSLEKQIKIAFDSAQFHKANAEKFKSEKDSLSKSNKSLSNRLSNLLKNQAAPCEDKLQLSLFYNDSLKLELNKCDSAYMEVDKEAEKYSNQVQYYKKLNLINIKRNKTLSDSVSSLHVLYTDSLTAQRKQSDKAIKKEKCKTFFYKVTTTIATALGIYGTIR